MYSCSIMFLSVAEGEEQPSLRVCSSLETVLFPLVSQGQSPVPPSSMKWIILPDG